MKWIFLLGLVVLTPALIIYLRSNRQKLPLFALLLGLLPFVEVGFKLSASPIAWPAWPGMSKGVTLSPVDSVAIAMIAASYSCKTPLRLKLAFALYVLAFLISTWAAEAAMASVLYGSQVLRAVLVYYAVARASVTNPEVPKGLLTGLIIGLATQAFSTLTQYLGGAVQAGGWFGHQNLLGMSTHFIIYPAFAAFLGGYYPKRTGAAVVMALIVAYTGGSRATIGLMAAGLALTLLLSIWNKRTTRKMAVAGAAALAAVVLAPVLYSAIERRPDEVREGSSAIRENMKDAADMILADHPLGVGSNRYVIEANLGGYSARAGVDWMSSAAPVHSAYHLVAAEMGWLGYFAFIAIFAAALSLAFGLARRTPASFGAEYACGVTAAFAMVAIHSRVEWITMSYPVHVFAAMSLGVMAALSAMVRGRQITTANKQRDALKSGQLSSSVGNETVLST